MRNDSTSFHGVIPRAYDFSAHIEGDIGADIDERNQPEEEEISPVGTPITEMAEIGGGRIAPDKPDDKRKYNQKNGQKNKANHYVDHILHHAKTLSCQNT